MHRINTKPGGWNHQTDGVIFLTQTPAPVVFLTAADTDIQTLAAAVAKLPNGFPALRVANLLQLQQQLTIDTYAEAVLEQAKVIIVRLLGGRSYWSYGLEVVQETVQRNGAALIVMPGDNTIDPDLITHSTISLLAVNQLWRYFTEGGVENVVNAVKFVADTCLNTAYNPPPPKLVPRVGLYAWRQESRGAQEQGGPGAGGQGGRGEIIIRLEKFGEEKCRGPVPPVEATSGTQTDTATRGATTRKTGATQPLNFSQNPKSKIQNSPSPQPPASSPSKVGILFYRAHYLAGNTSPIDALCQALIKKNLEPVPVFISSLRDRDVQAEILPYFVPSNEEKIQLLLNTTSFSLARLETEIEIISTPLAPSLQPLAPDIWQQLDVPVLQVIFSGGSAEGWESNFQGLSPRDIAMNVALPEVDGRIISRAVSFKAVQTWNSDLETDVVVYEAVSDRVAFVAQLAQGWVNLRSTPTKKRKIALILANYPSRNGRLANGVGLDTPASCIEILLALDEAGYQVENIPLGGDELIQRLTAGVTNDLEGNQLRPVHQQLSWEEYQEYFATLPQSVQQGISDRWKEPFETNRQDASRGFKPQGNAKKGNETNSFPSAPCAPCPSAFPISGIQLGNIFVGIQPARGYDIDPALNYHAPDLEPTHAYLAFYYWIREHFEADAVIHVGKHGNLEWLPGKSVALSNQCYPEVAFGALPHLYPFIVNDPGEGSQAKRRAQAVILDHLTPPMTRAELYGGLQQLEALIDEYYEAQSLDPSRLPIISDRITALILQENLHQDLGLDNGNYRTGGLSDILVNLQITRLNPPLPITNYQLPIDKLDGYLCELKEAQIRDGLHIFGQCPQQSQLRDLIVAIARQPCGDRSGLTVAIARDWGLDFDSLSTDLSTQLSAQEYQILALKTQQSCRTVGDAVEVLEQHAANLVEQLIHNSQLSQPNSELFLSPPDPPAHPHPGTATQRELGWIRDRLLPSLLQTDQEIANLLRGLDGRYVPPGPSGAPTRGRPEVLPTGRNFYSVDIRAIPTETAWDVGRKAAEVLIERYTQENGEYPKTLGLSVWGTSTMRTGGDDIAQALALLGVRPVWDGVSRRMVDFEILPLSILARPRVDVTLRISGFFRDAFPNLIDFFDSAVAAVAALDEPPEQNPLASQVKQETQLWESVGLTSQQAGARSHYRIFGSKPGAYGAGLQGLIEAQNWTDEGDLARAYINWSCYAYSRSSEGRSAPEAFEKRLQQMQIVLHNQDNREHDLLDSDDYYQFQGGLTAAVRSIQGKNPQTYFGDNSIPANPRIRHLKEEIARVYRSRVINPKWIAGVMRHGYKGAFEMAATVDYLFAYDATANCVEDYMYQGVAQAYLFDPSVQEFIQQKNPWALRDMAERLLEAHQRGMWQVDSQMVDKLRSLVHQAEAIIEES